MPIIKQLKYILKHVAIVLLHVQVGTWLNLIHQPLHESELELCLRPNTEPRSRMVPDSSSEG